MLVRQGRQSRKFNQCKNILNKEVSGTLEVGMGHTIVDKVVMTGFQVLYLLKSHHSTPVEQSNTVKVI